MIEYKIDEISSHNTIDDAWIIIDNDVYDITFFLNDHPGGKSILLQFAGTDVTDIFHELHNLSILTEYGDKFKIGYIIN